MKSVLEREVKNKAIVIMMILGVNDPTEKQTEQLLLQLNDQLETLLFHYKTAMIHGFKHGIEEMLKEEKTKRTPMIKFMKIFPVGYQNRNMSVRCCPWARIF